MPNKQHHPDDCPYRVMGSCRCDGALDDSCPKCNPSKYTNWCNNCDEHTIVQSTTMNASEALYGFAGWLTSRDTVVTLSSYHNAAVAADLVAEFCKVNDLPEVRALWPTNLKHPKED